MATGFKRSLVLNIALVVGALIVFAALFYVLGGQLDAKIAAIRTDRSLIARSSGAADRLAAFKGTEPAAAAYQRVIALFLPPQEGLLDLPRDVEAAGRLHQVGALFTFTPTGEGEKSNTLPFSITASGNGTNLISFMKDLELTHPRYTIAIDTADLTGVDPTKQQLLIEGHVFYKQ